MKFPKLRRHIRIIFVGMAALILAVAMVKSATAAVAIIDIFK